MGGVLRRVEPQATVQATGVEDYIHNLQYPLTGRTSCNDRIEAANECRTDFAVPSDGSNLRQLRTRRLCVLFSRLAVPSDGSNLRQHGRSPMLAYISQTCSTLKRVEPQATSPT